MASLTFFWIWASAFSRRVWMARFCSSLAFLSRLLRRLSAVCSTLSVSAKISRSFESLRASYLLRMSRTASSRSLRCLVSMSVLNFCHFLSLSLREAWRVTMRSFSSFNSSVSLWTSSLSLRFCFFSSLRSLEESVRSPSRSIFSDLRRLFSVLRTWISALNFSSSSLSSSLRRENFWLRRLILLSFSFDLWSSSSRRTLSSLISCSCLRASSAACTRLSFLSSRDELCSSIILLFFSSRTLTF
mmetsp:Transcript_43119/g.71824  ORF Transcript_43119/g.71824 Transcript_43119/m.71824 type:complete len:244 (+) Transcript_43119:366-1097(+)